MDEAKRVIARLERIETLKEGKAGPVELLAELRALLREGEAWLAAEGAGTARAGAALDRCRTVLEDATPSGCPERATRRAIESEQAPRRERAGAASMEERLVGEPTAKEVISRDGAI